MSSLTIVGGLPLMGEITVGGAKNAILPVLAATLLTKEECVINDVPPYQDVLVMLEILKHFGAKVSMSGTSVVVNCRDAMPVEAGANLMRKLRASNLVMGPLLSRFHYFKVSLPGGCDIGLRPIDYHIRGFERLGANVKIEKGGFVEAKNTKLYGAPIHLDYPSVGATENIMMSAVLAQGNTVIHGVAREPEITELQNFLNKIGAKVRGAGTDIISIEGVESLHGTEHTIIPDRIEAGTHIIAAAITSGKVLVKNIIPKHVESIMAKVCETGAIIRFNKDQMYVEGPVRPIAKDIKTLPYPGFPTDMQPQYMALMTMAEGTTIISENIFEKRFQHIDELRRMGANIKTETKLAIIRGVPFLSGACVEATDLRAGVALLLAALRAEGKTTISKVEHIDRGYYAIEKKYAALGANVARVSDCL